MDAETLARLGRVDPKLLAPIQHRGAQAQMDLGAIRLRAEPVGQRTALVNSARGTVKSMGERVPSCETKDWGVEKLAGWKLSEAVEQLVKPLVIVIGHLNQQIATYDARIEVMVKRYPQIAVLTPVYGVGDLISILG